MNPDVGSLADMGENRLRPQWARYRFARPRPLNTIAQFLGGASDERFIHQIAAGILTAVPDDVVLKLLRQAIPTETGIVGIIGPMKHDQSSGIRLGNVVPLGVKEGSPHITRSHCGRNPHAQSKKDRIGQRFKFCRLMLNENG